jgi:hypothetical protein
MIVPREILALFGIAYFQLLHKFKLKFCQTDNFCSSLSVQLLLKMKMCSSPARSREKKDAPLLP